MSPSHPSDRGLQAVHRLLPRVALGATLGLLALAVAVGPVQAAAQSSVKAKIQGRTLLVTGTSSADVIVLRLASGDPTTLEIDSGGDGSAEFRFKVSRFDAIQVDAGGGNDTLRADNVNGAFTIDEKTTLNGGPGDDTLIGGAGPETLVGDTGADTIDGNQGADTIQAGAGDDVIAWDPGDASDTVEGGAGSDRLAFNGANIGELYEASAVGGRVRFSRNIATVVLDLDDVERIDVRALGGADTLTVGDLAGTDLATVAVDLAASVGGGDGAADTIVVNGSAADDVVAIAAVSGGVEASRAGTATTRATGAEPALDSLVVNGLAGADTFDVAAGVDALIQLILSD